LNEILYFIRNTEINDFKRTLKNTILKSEPLVFEIYFGERPIFWECKNYKEPVSFNIKLFTKDDGNIVWQSITMRIHNYDVYIKLGNFKDEKIVLNNEEDYINNNYFKLNNDGLVIRYKVFHHYFYYLNFDQYYLVYHSLFYNYYPHLYILLI